MKDELTEAEAVQLNVSMDAIREQLRGIDPTLVLAALNVLSAELIARRVEPRHHADMVTNYAGQLRINVRQIGMAIGGHVPQAVH